MKKVLVDTENSVNLRDWAHLSKDCVIILFLSDRIPPINPLIKQLGNNWKIEVFYVYSSIKNAMDNAICEYIWKDSLKGDGSTEYIIISDDHDFDHAIRDMKDNGISVSRARLCNNSNNKPVKVKNSADDKHECSVSAHGTSSLDDLLTDAEMIKNTLDSSQESTNDISMLEDPSANVYPGTYTVDFTEDDTEVEASAAIPTIEELLEQTKLTHEEQLHPIRALGKIKRKECRDYLMSLGFSEEQAKAVCKSMKPYMAEMILKSRYSDRQHFQQILSRIDSRLKRIDTDNETVKRLLTEFTNNVTFPI